MLQQTKGKERNMEQIALFAAKDDGKDVKVFDIYLNNYFAETYFFPKYGAWPNQFQFVARVKAMDLNEVWRICNTVESPWWEKQEVEYTMIQNKALFKGFRSLSVGDCIRDVKTKIVYRVMITGFKVEERG
jgi:hypothetical protein